MNKQDKNNTTIENEYLKKMKLFESASIMTKFAKWMSQLFIYSAIIRLMLEAALEIMFQALIEFKYLPEESLSTPDMLSLATSVVLLLVVLGMII